jgi:hypothetical protein
MPSAQRLVDTLANQALVDQVDMATLVRLFVLFDALHHPFVLVPATGAGQVALKRKPCHLPQPIQHLVAQPAGPASLCCLVHVVHCSAHATLMRSECHVAAEIPILVKLWIQTYQSAWHNIRVHVWLVWLDWLNSDQMGWFGKHG